MSVMSEEGTVYGDDTSSLCGDWGTDGGDPTRDLLSRPPDPPPQPTPRPPPHAEVQLRYLLQVGVYDQFYSCRCTQASLYAFVLTVGSEL